MPRKAAVAFGRIRKATRTLQKCAVLLRETFNALLSRVFPRAHPQNMHIINNTLTTLVHLERQWAEYGTVTSRVGRERHGEL